MAPRTIRTARRVARRRPLGGGAAAELMRGARAAALVLCAGCTPEVTEKVVVTPDTCFSLRTEDTFPSMTQTFDVALDSARGRGVATGLGLPYLSVLDLGRGARTDAIRYSERSTTYPRAALDGAGTAWVASQSAPALVRIALDTRVVTPIPTVSEARWVVGLHAGVLVPRPTASDAPGVVRIDGDGAVLADSSLSAARAGAAHPDGVVVLTDTEAVVLDADTLVEGERCDLPFSGDRVTALDDGTLYVSDGTRLARLGCADATPETWTVGVEITALVSDGVTAWALDRIGEADPTGGVTWRIAPNAAPILDFSTGKNTGYGDVDRATGTLWVNAEGTAEVHAYTLANGARAAAVSTGTFVDGLALAPDGAVLATGRLSGLFARFDGESAVRGAAVRWPWSPVVSGDAIWMLGQLDGQLASFDAATLGTRTHVDLGAGPNPLLTFSGLARADDRGTLLVAESNADLLLEIDASGVELGRWALGGPPVDDPDFGAHLDLLYRDGVAWLARTSDGRLQRIDLETGERVDARLDATALRTLQDRRRTHVLRWDGAGPRVGPFGLDPDTLAVTDTRDAIAALLAPWPDGDGWLALDNTGTALLRLDANGDTITTHPWFAERQPGTVAVFSEDGSAVWVNRAYEGLLCRVPVAARFGG